MALLWTLCCYVIFPCLILLAAYTYYMSKNHGMLKKLGIPGPTPWPIFGTILKESKRGLFQYHVEAYRKYRGAKAYSSYMGRTPLLMIRDLDIIRDICVKHFYNFTNRSPVDIEYPLNHAMINLKDDHWKRVRSAVSPTFTSGKIKRMDSLLQHNAAQMVKYLTDKMERNEDVELKDVLSRYTMDTIASTGFGVTIDSFKDKENKFTVEGKKMLQGLNNVFVLTLFFDFLWPVVKRVTTMVPSESIRFFKVFVDRAIEERKSDIDSKQSSRNDFLQLVLEAQQQQAESDSGQDGASKNMLTYDDIQGQALIFILGGFDTTSAAMAFTCYLLALNPECCQKVQEEIDDVLEGASPNYDTVQQLVYLDMCLNEALRMYPPAFIFERHCNEEIEIQGLKIPKDVLVMIPVCGIHNDPEIYPEPEKFRPERFTQEAKAARHPYAHLPFGNGPRNCIGMRLALLTVKLGLASILQVMTPVRCEKSVYPVRLQTINFESLDGLWVKLQPRNLNKVT